MSNIVDPITTVTTSVSQRFEGLSHGVTEWPGYTHRGKPALVTLVIITYRVTETGLSAPEVKMDAYPLKKDGTPAVNRIDTSFWSYGPSATALKDELIAAYGSDVRAEAERIWKKLYA